MGLQEYVRDFPNIKRNIGPDSIFFFDDFQRLDGTPQATGVSTYYTFLTDTATFLLDTTVGGGALKMSFKGDAEDDVMGITSNAGFKLSDLKAGHPIYWGFRFKVTDADDIHLHIGLGIQDDSYQASAPADMCVLQLVETAATANIIARKNSASSAHTAAFTLADDTYARCFFEYIPSGTLDIGSLNYVIHHNGTVTEGTLPTAGNFPDDVVLMLVCQAQSGAAAADPVSLDWWFYHGQRADWVDGTG